MKVSVSILWYQASSRWSEIFRSTRPVGKIVQADFGRDEAPSIFSSSNILLKDDRWVKGPLCTCRMMKRGSRAMRLPIT